MFQRKLKRSNRANPKPRPTRPFNPPQIVSSVGVNKIFRFTGTVTGLSTILYSDIMSYVLMAVDATHVTNMFETCKINSIEVWAQNGSTSANLIALELPANDDYLGSRSAIYTNETLSADKPSHVFCRPPATSAQSFWQRSSSLVAFNLTTSANSVVVIDLNISYVVSDKILALPSRVVVGATANSIYYGAMEAARGFLPLGLPSI